MKEWIAPVLVVALFAAILIDGTYNESKFDNRCKVAGGISTGSHTVCVKQDSILFKSH